MSPSVRKDHVCLHLKIAEKKICSLRTNIHIILDYSHFLKIRVALFLFLYEITQKCDTSCRIWSYLLVSLHPLLIRVL